MATVPGILYIGDYQAQGGNPGLNATADGLMASPLDYSRDRKWLRFTPDEADGTPATTFYPWYEGSAGATNYTVGSSSTTTITASGSPGWTTNQWAGRRVTVLNTSPIPGVGIAQRLVVTSNTANQVTFGATTAPTVGAVFFLGQGRFISYHPVAGRLSASEIIAGQASFRSGSAWQASGLGMSCDLTLIRALTDDVYDASPYFHFVKWADPATVNTGWADSPNDSARAAFLPEFARVATAATERSNTIAWDVGILDSSMADLEAAISNPLLLLTYETRLREQIAWLKSAAVCNNSSLKVLLVNHSQDMWMVTGVGGVAWMRAAHIAVARDTANVAIVDMSGQSLGVAGDALATEAKYYSLGGYGWMGEEMARQINRLAAGSSQPFDGSLPTYLQFGDSIFVGPITSTWTGALNSEELEGPNAGNFQRPANQLIWNESAGAVQVYEPHTNSNTAGSVGATAGPDLSIMAELSRIHPGGFCLFKRASNGSALASEASAYSSGDGGRWISGAGEHYADALEDWSAFVQYVNLVLGKQVDTRGAIVSLGHNDQTVAGGGEAFAAALPGFCADLRADFSTRSSGDNFPIIWRRPQDDAAFVTAARMAEVRAALDTQTDVDAKFRWVDVDDLERDRDDDLHETPESAVVGGRRYVTELNALSI